MMDPGLRGDDILERTVIPAKAGIHKKQTKK
jgi:hypothetical protein